MLFDIKIKPRRKCPFKCICNGNLEGRLCSGR